MHRCHVLDLSSSTLTDHALEKPACLGVNPGTGRAHHFATLWRLFDLDEPLAAMCVIFSSSDIVGHLQCYSE